MKEQVQIEMKPSPKGVRVPLTTDLTVFIAETTAELQKAWNEADTQSGFWEELDDLGYKFALDATGKYGDRKYKGFGIREDEFRITVINKGGNLSIDFRNWWS